MTTSPVPGFVPELDTQPLDATGHVALLVEYDGAGYHGWQSQRNQLITVQDVLEKALSKVADHPVEVVCAGRTDSGVHALGQVVHFDTRAQRSRRAWVLGANTFLPQDVSVLWAQAVPATFHARYSAIARRYRYVIYNHPVRPALMRHHASWCHVPLAAEPMHEAAQGLLGENDFTSYRAAGCQSNSPFRCIHDISVQRYGHYVVIEVQANAFLHHMVRNIAGVLMEVGKGVQPITWPAHLLEVRDRKQAAVTAPPNGLYFMRVSFDQDYGLPVLDMPFLI